MEGDLEFQVVIETLEVINVLMDRGSTCNFMSTNRIMRLGFDQFWPTLVILFIGGQRISSLGMLHQIHMQIRDEFCELDYITIDSLNSNPFSILLGNSWIH